MEQAADRLEMILRQAVGPAGELKPDHGHAMIVAAMTSFYLTSPEARALELNDLWDRLRKNIGALDSPTMLVMYARDIRIYGIYRTLCAGTSIRRARMLERHHARLGQNPTKEEGKARCP